MSLGVVFLREGGPYSHYYPRKGVNTMELLIIIAIAAACLYQWKCGGSMQREINKKWRAEHQLRVHYNDGTTKTTLAMWAGKVVKVDETDCGTWDVYEVLDYDREGHEVWAGQLLRKERRYS